MHLRKILPALVIAGALNTPLAQAATLQADVESETCVATNTDSAPVVQFWSELEEDVRATRLAELEATDPGITVAIASYVAKEPGAPTAAELQTRLDADQSGEGLAMLIPEDASDSSLPGNTEDFKTTYTYDEAKSAIAGISDDPAAHVLTQLQDAAATSTRIAEIRAEKFAEKTQDYNETQQSLKSDFQACVDAIDAARPFPVQYLIVGAVVAIALVALALRAFSNARKTARHTS
ncbi:hypothetical protein SFC07_04215 [Corynebacterium callunae]|uniref:hypothetical protein n=1 Tax=Corynebacterium callunae TaxID=1721 RepID=UPI003981FDFF